ncbi:MAG: enoyl-CoA hydratase/isomerase family protein [Oscillospiraceae bacterium]|nr:enoyl-CoA hydratase/isomerase family protein [Oscillospiraceae bacterium]
MDFEYEAVRVEISGAVATLTIDNPKKRNAMTSAAHRDIYRFVQMLDGDRSLRAGIITGRGDKVFSSGNDVSEFKRPDNFWPKNTLLEAVDRVWNSNTPIIMAINGHCVGGGLELALAGDIIIMSENATLSLPETTLGIIPGACGIQRLARCCGVATAKEMALTGRRMDAREALSRGIACAVTSSEALMREAADIAARLSERAPLALAVSKRAANAALDTDYNTARLMEQWGEQVLIGTSDFVEGIAAFSEKRAPEYEGK